MRPVKPRRDAVRGAIAPQLASARTAGATPGCPPPTTSAVRVRPSPSLVVGHLRRATMEPSGQLAVVRDANLAAGGEDHVVVLHQRQGGGVRVAQQERGSGWLVGFSSSCPRSLHAPPRDPRSQRHSEEGGARFTSGWGGVDSAALAMHLLGSCARTCRSLTHLWQNSRAVKRPPVTFALRETGGGGRGAGHGSAGGDAPRQPRVRGGENSATGWPKEPRVVCEFEALVVMASRARARAVGRWPSRNRASPRRRPALWVRRGPGQATRRRARPSRMAAILPTSALCRQGLVERQDWWDVSMRLKPS